VLVDSLQRGDRQDYDLFPQSYHEPYYLSHLAACRT
jgi:hypothetical protein